MLSILNNPLTHWLRWLFKKWSLEFKYRKQHLHIEYMAVIQNCKFNNYNTVYKHSQLRDSELGDFSYVGKDCQIYHTKIGKFTCIGPHVNTGMGAHPSNTFVSIHPLFYSTLGQSSGLVIVENNLFEEHPETTIGNDVWIGNNVTIKYGVTVGDGSIIGSGAIVTKDVEPYSIIGGVPAKIIKYRFSPEQIEFLEKFQWWNKDLEWIKTNKDLFTNIEKFMAQYAKP